MSLRSTLSSLFLLFRALTSICAVITTTFWFRRRYLRGISVALAPEISPTGYSSPRKASNRSFCWRTRFNVLTMKTTLGSFLVLLPASILIVEMNKVF